MARPTAVQSHQDRDYIERALLSGGNPVQIAKETGVSVSSLYRTRQALLREREASDTVANLSRVAIAQRLAGIAADLRHTRLSAAAKGQTRTQTMAAAEERRTLVELLALAPEMDAAEAAGDAEAIAAALSGLLRDRRDYVLTAELAAQLRAQGASDQLVGSVEDLALRLKEEK